MRIKNPVMTPNNLMVLGEAVMTGIGEKDCYKKNNKTVQIIQTN